MKNKKDLIFALVLLAAAVALVAVLDQVLPQTGIVMTVLKKSCIYSLVAVAMNLLNGFTGLFSLGQAGFMLIGGYTYAILTIPAADRASVYQYFDGGIVKFSVPFWVGLICAGLVSALLAWLIGLPVLRLKSDYLAIATLGFAEIVRAFFQWDTLGPLTNGSNMLRKYPSFSTLMFPFIVSAICIALIVLLINSTFGRALRAIKDDEIAAEAMGINLARHKMISFVTSSFFAGVAGATLAMVLSIAQANNFKSAMTYEILLMVVLGGIGSITGSVIGSLLFVAASEWWLRGLDSGKFLGIEAPNIFRNGFRLVVFSIIIMIVVLFFRKGIMGEKELPDLFRRKKKEAPAKEGQA